MKTTRRAFLKSAAVACSVTPCLGKDADTAPPEQAQEMPWMYDRDGQLCWRWGWTLGPWERGRRSWQATIIVPNHSRSKALLAILQNSLRTNRRVFCGVKRDRLLLCGMDWQATDGARLATVHLREFRTPHGVSLVRATGMPMIPIRRYRIYERVNFYDIMPGQHRVIQ